MPGFCSCGLFVGGNAADGPIEADILIEGGRLYDGSGGEPVLGNVAIKGGRIIAVGRFAVAGPPEIIDAQGLCVAPGFIDLHTHTDRSITTDNGRASVNYLRQGCTTVVTGNCGGGKLDVGKFFAEIEKDGAGTNVVHLVPQGTVRGKVMGSVSRAPTEEELAKMRELVAKGMRQGAFGMSTGLIYLPGTFSDTKELIELAKVVSKHGGIYATHIRTEGTGVVKAIQEAITIGKESGCPVHISHLKASGVDAWGLSADIIATIRAARQEGLRVTADQYPYTASSTSLAACVIPTWARQGGNKRLLARLDDESDGARIRKAMARSLDRRGGGSRLQIASYRKEPKWAGKTIAQIAEETGKSPLDVCLEITRGGGASVVSFSMSAEDVQRIAGQDFVATGSDGSARKPSRDKPHPRSYGTFPRKIGEYAHRRGWFSVEQAIRSATGLPADILGLEDRGYLKPGYVADIVVFDLDKLKDHATFQEPHQYCTGLKRVYVAGQAAVVDDRATGLLAGRPLRH